MLKKHKDFYYCNQTGKLFDKLGKDKKEITSHPLLNDTNFVKLKKFVLEEAGEQELAKKVVEEGRQAKIAQVVEEVAQTAPMKAEVIKEPLKIESQKIDVELEEVELPNGKKVYNTKVLSQE